MKTSNRSFERVFQLPIVPEKAYHPAVIDLLTERYFLTDRLGQPIENVVGMWKRVARAIAAADVQYGEDADATFELFHHALASNVFLPNTPGIMNAGKHDGQLCGCFLLPLEDDASQQLEAQYKAGMIHKTGGGTGFAFSKMRPKGDRISSGGTAYGIFPLMEAIDATTAAFKQSGRRRGANMGVLHISHPQVSEFISCKSEEGRLENFNISLMVSDDFFLAVEQDLYWDLVNPRTGKVVEQVRARDLFEAIATQAWTRGEPGLLFDDALNANHPLASLGRVTGTNPCGEVCSPSPAICNLGSINLSLCVKDGNFDWELFKELCYLGVHYLDNVIDVNHSPFPEFEEFSKTTRITGLGIMGWHDCLLKMGIRYDSEEALSVAESIGGFYQTATTQASEELSQKRGVYFLPGATRRNAILRSIAPTGTISFIAQCSQGLEPMYAWRMERRIGRTKGDPGKTVELVHPLCNEYLGQQLPDHFVTANQIPWEWHVKHQATWQRYTDGAISKTINMFEGHTVEDVQNAYLLAWKSGCKGITVYRDGSRTGQTLVSKDNCPECLDGSCPISN